MENADEQGKTFKQQKLDVIRHTTSVRNLLNLGNCRGLGARKHIRPDG